MIGFDFVIAGASLGFVGSFIMAKSFLKPSFQRQVTQSYLGQNPYLARFPGSYQWGCVHKPATILVLKPSKIQPPRSGLPMSSNQMFIGLSREQSFQDH